MHTDVVVVGAGVVGLAIARAAALAGKEVVVLEAESRFGTATSARNSGVIHAGLYYDELPLKRELCVRGRHALYDFCRSHHVPHRQLGKLIVAFHEGEEARLGQILHHAAAADVNNLVALDAAQVRALEPELSCASALLSPSTGIVDVHALMLALLGGAQDAGAVLARNTRAVAITRGTSYPWVVRTEGDEAGSIEARWVVNAAGHGATDLSRTIELLNEEWVPPLHLARGHYFAYGGQVPFARLIYPLPVPGGLGTHLTLDLAGGARFGPDVEWVEALEYSMDNADRDAFVQAARSIWPNLDADKLRPDYCGIRPKVSAPGEPAADFIISCPAEHGLEGLVCLYGIESPGMTASLALADTVIERLQRHS
ncbi:NAD(P)/FAD-dependent oxidoreductase [Sphingomonas aracearum]|uniref:NAD(P)/FAD-dependent oxidoreductase n=1 Tax=Sphingomonas aracearum TaxID=2283317 RepID=A0A369VYT8_9SPHN|nr:NAD(P)/FAD-dependent oxidoreductase [Sphingomonas aracearum]RDE06290.1 NAD(P)/FAD-dependent oxidoreductase [Sphingomonas aracearum]